MYRGALASNVKTFDPTQAGDLYSNICQQLIYETLYQYKYLTRPYDIEPSLAEALPTISDSGRIYIIPIKHGIHFTDDPCFPQGKGREMKAQDFIYAVKRLADVRNKSTGWWIFDGKIVGLDAFHEETQKLPPLPEQLYPKLYDKTIEGIRTLDDYTIRIQLTKPYPYFKYILAMPYNALLPREAVEYYGEEFLNHPVGTGPYRLSEWRHGLRLIFDRNPDYHHGFYPNEGEASDSVQGLLADAGKPLPFIDRIELNIFEESQPMWLNFLNGNLERSSIPKDNYAQAITPQKNLRDDYGKKGIQLIQGDDLDLTYVLFNFEDPIVGKNKKLRQAMSLATDVEDLIDLFYNGCATRAQSPIPPGLFGYEATYKKPYGHFNLAEAKQKLAEAGYPNGKGLPALEYMIPASTNSRQGAEHFAKDMAKIGIQIKVASYTWPEFLTRLKKKTCQLAGSAWGADYPDPENFLQLLYGPNEAPGENNANYKNATYDSLYRDIAIMQDTPERLIKIKKMEAIIGEDCPWILETHRLREYLNYSWLKNHKPNAVEEMPLKYYKIDQALRQKFLVN